MHDHYSASRIESSGFDDGRGRSMQKLVTNVRRKFTGQAKLFLDEFQALNLSHGRSGIPLVQRFAKRLRDFAFYHNGHQVPIAGFGKNKNVVLRWPAAARRQGYLILWKGKQKLHLLK